MKKQDQHIPILAGGFVALLALVFFFGRGAPSRSSLAGLILPAVSGAVAQDVGTCSTPKCLTVYVSPWCSICRASTPLLKNLLPWLDERGVAARIVVGRDKEDAIRAYAAEFGPNTLMDLSAEFPLQGGVPSFVVSDGAGKILKVMPGVPRIYTEPIRNEYLAEVAKFLDLI